MILCARCWCRFGCKCLLEFYSRCYCSSMKIKAIVNVRKSPHTSVILCKVSRSFVLCIIIFTLQFSLVVSLLRLSPHCVRLNALKRRDRTCVRRPESNFRGASRHGCSTTSTASSPASRHSILFNQIQLCTSNSFLLTDFSQMHGQQQRYSFPDKEHKELA